MQGETLKTDREKRAAKEEKKQNAGSGKDQILVSSMLGFKELNF